MRLDLAPITARRVFQYHACSRILVPPLHLNKAPLKGFPSLRRSDDLEVFLKLSRQLVVAECCEVSRRGLRCYGCPIPSFLILISSHNRVLHKPAALLFIQDELILNDMPTNQRKIHDDEIDLVAIFINLWKQRLFILTIIIIAGIVGLLVAVLTPKQYAVSTLLRPTAINDLDALNRSQVYTLPPTEALNKIGQIAIRRLEALAPALRSSALQRLFPGKTGS
ncbi:MAG: hypothetical protein EOP06_14560 [Proteobacteria bacterium]|nr:MAG: hypothetical protein EOP06_14560 [Pseudomonadota bacterium]